jgi:translation elongation factor aEF-1 beta
LTVQNATKQSLSGAATAGKLPRLTNVPNAVLRVLKMGKVIVQARVMPENLKTDMEDLKSKVKDVISSHGDFGTAKDVPIAFGLRALVFSFILEDKEGVMGAVEEELKAIPGVQSLDVIDVRRAL